MFPSINGEETNRHRLANRPSVSGCNSSYLLAAADPLQSFLCCFSWSSWQLGTQGPLQMVYNYLAVTPTMSTAASTWAVWLIPAAHGTASLKLGSPKPGL